MSEQPEHKVRRIAELVHNGEYLVDPSAVADALLRHVRWDDVPELSELTELAQSRRRIVRLRGFLRVRRLAGAGLATS